MSPLVISVVGARPQLIKAAAVSHAIARHGGIREKLVHTGQHFDPDMSDVFFKELAMPEPAYNLGVHSLSHGAMSGRMIEMLEEVLLKEKPDIVLLYGDTNSTLAGAVAASKLHIPIAHVEAGLRSFNRRMPEEINRVVADHLSELLFCPTRTAVDNLATEGITAGVHLVGDVMYDMTLAAIERAEHASRILESLRLQPKTYAVATVHRAENTDDPERFGRIVAWLRRASQDQPIVMPIHPRTRRLVEAAALSDERIRTIDPLGYLDMVRLVQNAAAVFTDSGGVQKETYFHRVPCVTLRDETEWVETIEAGWNRLWTVEHYQPRRDIPDYGNGHAAEMIVDLLIGRAGAAAA